MCVRLCVCVCVRAFERVEGDGGCPAASWAELPQAKSHSGIAVLAPAANRGAILDCHLLVPPHGLSLSSLAKANKNPLVQKGKVRPRDGSGVALVTP